MSNQRTKKSSARELAEAMVDRYLDWLYSSNKDAGWHGHALIGRLIDFKGELPQGSGFFGFDRYEREIRYLAYISEDTRRAVEIIDAMPEDHRVAVLSDRAYRGRTKVAVDPFAPEKPVEIAWTTEACARELGLTPDTYRKHISRGYAAIELAIEGRKAA